MSRQIPSEKQKFKQMFTYHFWKVSSWMFIQNIETQMSTTESVHNLFWWVSIILYWSSSIPIFFTDYKSTYLAYHFQQLLGKLCSLIRINSIRLTTCKCFESSSMFMSSVISMCCCFKWKLIHVFNLKFTGLKIS